MEGELLGAGGLWLPWTLSPLPSEQLPPGLWRPQSFGAASQRPNSWWTPPTIRLRGGGPGSGVCVSLGRVAEGGWAPTKVISPITLPLGTTGAVPCW